MGANTTIGRASGTFLLKFFVDVDVDVDDVVVVVVIMDERVASSSTM